MMQCREPTPQLLDELRTIVGSEGWLDSAEGEKFLRDPRDRTQGQAVMILRPATTAEVAKIVRLCGPAGVGLIPYAGGTGLVGGQLIDTTSNCVVLSVDRMRAVRETSTLDGTMTVEAGCTLAEVRATAVKLGRRFPLRIASENDCRIGGNLATNAGGMNVLRYGNARDLCLGLEVVMADGQVWDGLTSLRKDNTGYNLRDLMIGSEGTLGIITAATLRLFPEPAEIATALVAVADVNSAVQLAEKFRVDLGEVLSLSELMESTGFRFVTEHFATLQNPIHDDHDWYVMVEAEGGDGSQVRSRLESVLATAMESGLVLDAVLAENEAQRQTMYDLRETIPLANRRVGSVATHDVAVPLGRIGNMVAAVKQIVNKHEPQLQTNIFGHLGDGNLHANVFPPTGSKAMEFRHLQADLTRDVFAAVRELGGSISAEHGVGRSRKIEATIGRGQAVRWAAMQAIKHALDPHGILNPGVVVDSTSAT